jgi:hyperosmotically inducible periplasmic protein
MHFFTYERPLHLVKEPPMHFANQVALVIILIMLVAVAAGCSKPPLPKTEASAGSSSSQADKAAPSEKTSAEKTPGQRLDQATADAKRTAGDAALTVKVKAALANDAGLRTLKLEVDANSGVVTIKGQVDSDDSKKRVHEIAQAVPGVTWVQNQISVAPKAG